MNCPVLVLVSPFLGLAANVCVQVLLCRYGRVRLLKTVFAGFFAGLALTACFGALAPGAMLPNLCICAFLGYGYFHFVNLGETARRIRILIEIHSSPNGLTEAEILARYNAREILDKRFGRLLTNGQITEKNGRLFIKPSLMLYITRLFILAKRIILGA